MAADTLAEIESLCLLEEAAGNPLTWGKLATMFRAIRERHDTSTSRSVCETCLGSGAETHYPLGRDPVQTVCPSCAGSGVS